MQRRLVAWLHSHGNTNLAALLKLASDMLNKMLCRKAEHFLLIGINRLLQQFIDLNDENCYH